MCAAGTPYNFHVRPAESNDVLLYFNGGGACWFGLICDPALQPTYTQDVLSGGNNVEALVTGIFDFTNPENPFADYNVVFVPYCTADVHLGDATVEYAVEAEGVEAHTVTINHNGYNNALSAITWIYENFESPDSVFVTGSSAGALGSSFYAGVMAEAYPDSPIIQLGDGAGGYRSELAASILNTWGLFLEGDGVGSFEDIYIGVTLAYPNVTMAQYNTAEDEVQYLFLSLLGVVDTPLPDLLAANIGDIEAGIEADLPTFLAGGSLHTILRSPETYTYAADGVRFIDWLTALAAGEEVGDATCVDCSAPEVVEVTE